jgi:hypothetical protein
MNFSDCNLKALHDRMDRVRDRLDGTGWISVRNNLNDILYSIRKIDLSHESIDLNIDLGNISERIDTVGRRLDDTKIVLYFAKRRRVL